jgi:8-oxo-dGTP diphosphatase
MSNGKENWRRSQKALANQARLTPLLTKIQPNDRLSKDDCDVCTGLFLGTGPFFLDARRRVRYDRFMETLPTSNPVSSRPEEKYPKPSVTVDVVLFTFTGGSLRVLLIRRNGDPFKGRWALPGGFVQENERLEDAAARELFEETGLKDIYLEQLYTFGDPGRDPRGWTISVAYFAIVSEDMTGEVHAGDDAGDAGWFDVYHLPPLAFDHDRIVRYALQRLRYKLEYTGLGFLLLPEEFTLSQLQIVYEVVLQEKLDKRNFRKKVLSMDIIEETGKLRHGDHRPAKLYRFTAAAIELEKARRRFP